MNKLAALFLVSALVSPAFATETRTPAKKAQAAKVQTHKPMVRKATHKLNRHKAAAKTMVSSLRGPDYPWVMPS